MFVEQYATRVGIEGATAAQIARTLLVPAALHQRRLIESAGGPLVPTLTEELDEVLEALVDGVRALEGSNASGGDEGAARALRVRDEILPAMGVVRAPRTASSTSSRTSCGRSRGTRRCSTSAESPDRADRSGTRIESLYNSGQGVTHSPLSRRGGPPTKPRRPHITHRALLGSPARSARLRPAVPTPTRLAPNPPHTTHEPCCHTRRPDTLRRSRDGR